MTLNQDDAIILTCWYSSEYNIADEAFGNLMNTIQKHDDGWKIRCYLYRIICENVVFEVANQNSFKLLINKTKNLKLYEDLFKYFHI